MRRTTTRSAVQLRTLNRLLALETACLMQRAYDHAGPHGARLEALASEVEERRHEVSRALKQLEVVPDSTSLMLAEVHHRARVAVDLIRSPSQVILADLAASHRITDRIGYTQTFELSSKAGTVRTLADSLSAVQCEITAVLQDLLTSGDGRTTEAGDDEGTGNFIGWVSSLSDTLTRVLDRLVHRFSQRREADVTDDRSSSPGRIDWRSPPEDEERYLPIKEYDLLTAQAAAAAVRRLDEVDQVQEIAVYEGRHKKRRTVTAAAASHRGALERQHR